MQKEFRNSQFINIYFHKFAPSRRSPPCWPRSFLWGGGTSTSLSLYVAVTVSPSRPLGLCDWGGGGGVLSWLRLSFLQLRRPLPESPLPACVSKPCLSLSLRVSPTLGRWVSLQVRESSPRPLLPGQEAAGSDGTLVGRGKPFEGSEGRGRFPGNRRPIGGAATD